MSRKLNGHQPTDHQPTTPDADRIHAVIETEPHPDRPGWRVAVVAWRDGDDVTVWASEGAVVVKRDSLNSDFKN